MLTEEEKKAAKTARFFESEWWGKGKYGWPAALVAQLRNATFVSLGRGKYWRPENEQSRRIVYSALREIEEWLGFDSTTEAYCDALPRLRKRIFERATY